MEKMTISEQELQDLCAALDNMSRAELKHEWRKIMGCECYTQKTSLIRNRLKWRLTAMACGGIAKEVFLRASELADLTQLQERAPYDHAQGRPRRNRPAKRPQRNGLRPGSYIRKEWKGSTHVVFVEGEHCFRYEDLSYPSLSSVATHIAGYKISGNKFFNIK